MTDILYYTDLNNVNVELFNRFGMDYPKERRFRCVCCKEPICLDKGYSSSGRRMICLACYAKYFNSDILAAHAWMREGAHNGN